MEMNPCDMTDSYLKNARALGINRISIGVQSHDDRLLQAIGRLHNASEAEKAVKRAYALGFHNMSIDLIAYGAFFVSDALNTLSASAEARELDKGRSDVAAATTGVVDS